MSQYTTRALSAATAATADNTALCVWNPDTAKRIKLVEFGCFCVTAPGAGAGLVLARQTTRGTPGATVTPDADNAWDADDIPASGFLLDTTHSAQGTKQTPPLWGWVASGAIGAGIIWPTPRGIYIPPGAGLSFQNRAAIAFPASEFYVTIEE